MISNKRSPMVREDKNLKVSPAITEEHEKLKRENDWALRKGRAREEKYAIYPELLDRELSRTIEALNEAMEKMRYDENMRLLIGGYVDYLQEFGHNFKYLELRSYRNGILATLRECAKQYQMVEEVPLARR